MIYIIDFVDTTTNSIIQQYFLNNNITLIKEFSALGKVYQVESSVQPPTDLTITSIIEDSSVVITPLGIEYRTFPITEDDQHWWKLATVNIKDFNTEEVKHPMNFSNINVYILDGGIKADHPEFTGVNIENVYSYNGSYNDESGHGTAIASIISGNTCALSTANLKIVKLFGAEPSYQSHLLSALDTIITHSNASNLASIINISWNIPKNSYVESKLQKLIDNNVLIICAAGNSGQPIENVTPASMASAITVGAYNKDFRPCNFSNYTGATSNTQDIVNYGSLDIWAPGEQIYVATIDGGYGFVGGTSIAEAIESSVLAYQLGDQNSVGISNGLAYDGLKATFERTECTRNGILVLENQYANSINRLSSINSNYSDEKSYQTRFISNFGITLTADESSKDWVYYPRFSGNMTIVTPLPNGLFIDNGWLCGTATLSNDDLYKVHEIKIVHTSSDEQYTAEQIFRLSIVKPGITLEMLPDDVDEDIISYVIAALDGSFCGGTPTYGWGYCGRMCTPTGGFPSYCIDFEFYCYGYKTRLCTCQTMCP